MVEWLSCHVSIQVYEFRPWEPSCNWKKKREDDGDITSRCGFNFFNFHPYLGKIPILTNIFQRG